MLDQDTIKHINELISRFVNGQIEYEFFTVNNTVELSRAVALKRAGNIVLANRVYQQGLAEGWYVNNVYWGWVKVLLLAKCFQDAQLVLKLEHASLVRFFQLDEYHPNNTLEHYKKFWKNIPTRIIPKGSTGSLAPINENVWKNTSWIELLSDFNFKPFSYFTAKAIIDLSKQFELEGKIAAFGGSDYWSNYSLSDVEYRDFLKYFGQN